MTGIFKEVKEEIMKVGALIVKERLSEGETMIFTMTKYCESSFKVSLTSSENLSNILCEFFI